jgi:hypothetical protein
MCLNHLWDFFNLPSGGLFFLLVCVGVSFLIALVDASVKRWFIFLSVGAGVASRRSFTMA